MSGGFEALGLMPELLQSVAELGWSLPTDVQDESIPLILGGGDVMVASETGTGKTAAFCLPILQCVHERLREVELKDSGGQAEGPYDIKVSSFQKDAALRTSENGTSCSSTEPKNWIGARASHGVRSGKYYYEVSITGTGVCRVGWSTTSAHLELGKDTYGYGYGGTSMRSNDNKFEAYGEKFGNSDTIGCYLDWDERTISYSKNGTHLGIAFKISDAITGSALFPAFVVQNVSLTTNFSGNIPFRSFVQDTLHEGFITLSQAAPEDIVCESSKEAFAVRGKRLPLAIIIEPTKELAEQVYSSLLEMSRYLDGPSLKVQLLIGGDRPKAHSSDVGGVDIVVGTPARLCSLADSKTLVLSQIRFFVLDEADALVSGDHYVPVLKLFDKCPSGGNGDNRLQVCFFSATLHSPAITALASKICENPTWVDLKGASYVPETVQHVVYRVDPKQSGEIGKYSRLVTDNVHSDLSSRKRKDMRGNSSPTPTANVTVTVTATDTKGENEKINGKRKGDTQTAEAMDVQGSGDVDQPENESGSDSENAASLRVKELKLHVLLKILNKFETSQCMIFCRTNVDCNNLEYFLNNTDTEGKPIFGKRNTGKENPYSCRVLAGGKSTEERKKGLEAFKDGVIRFLICTDLAARGIDVEGLPFVINMTLPDSAETYIHRVGRVGRAGTAGLAISLVAAEGVKERVWYHTCGSKSCTNSRLDSEGGCTIWQDESDLLTEVERRLESAIPAMDQSCDLPACARSTSTVVGTVFGQKVEQVSGGVVNLHQQDLSVALSALIALEHSAQNNFLNMQSQFKISS